MTPTAEPVAPSAPPAAAPAAPAAPSSPPPVRLADPLPASARITTDSRHDATEFFEKHKAAQAAGVAASAVSPAAPAAPPPGAQPPAAPVAEPVPDSGLIDRFLPDASRRPVAPPAAAVAPSDIPLDQITLPSTASTAAHDSFRLIKTRAEGLAQQLATLSQREAQLKVDLENAKKGVVGPDGEEVARLRAEHKQMSDRLMLVDLQEHPKFKAEFIAPRDEALRAAQEVAGPTVNLNAMLALPRSEFGAAVTAAAKGLSDFDRVDFVDNMRKAYAIKGQADQALSRSREIYTGLRQQTAQGQKKAFDSVIGPLWAQVSEHLVKTEIPANAPPEQRRAIESYNADLEAIRTNAEKIALGPSDERGIATAAVKAAAYDFHINRAIPRILGEYQAMKNALQTANAALADLRSRAPGRQFTPSPAAGPGQGGPDPSKMNHHEAAEYYATRGGGRV